ncbi:MAG TPA: hypothetical protein VGJ21_05615 [Terracidiphilus sp.]|jgi:hypothetical protein
MRLQTYYSCLAILGGLVACVCIGTSAAQSPVAEARFAVEIPDWEGRPPTYLTIRNQCSMYRYGKQLLRLPALDPSETQPSALKLEYSATGDGVSMTATVFYGDFDPLATASIKKLPRKIVGTYFGKLNGSVTLSELEQVGIKPLTLRIVTAEPENPWHPILRSNAPSLQIDYAQVDRDYGTVTVHNKSSKGVVAFYFGARRVENGYDDWGEEPSARQRFSATIEPGATYQTQVSVRSKAVKKHGVWEEMPLPAFLTVQSALFADGSYEGDEHLAMEMAAHRIGCTAQARRVLRMAQPLVADRRTDDESKINAIRTGASQLSVEPSVDMLNDLRAEFPDLTPGALSGARPEMARGMKEEKKFVDTQIRDYEVQIRNHEDGIAFKRWWAQVFKKDI